MLEDGLLRTPNPCASAGSGTDRTMILHQKIAIPRLSPSRHITFLVSNFGQTSDPPGQTLLAGKLCLISFARSGLSNSDQFFQGVFPQHVFDFTNELSREFCVRIRKT